MVKEKAIITTDSSFDFELKNMQSQERELFNADIEKRDIEIGQFKLLRDILYPNVQSYKTLFLAFDYCKSRKLDIFKKSIQIVPIWNKNKRKYEDTIWPSIGELRVTAHRTGQFAGNDKPEFGAIISKKINGISIDFPEYCIYTVYRLVNGIKCPFTATVRWLEVYQTEGDGTPNAMWSKRSFGQLEKCAEAAALRMAFPEEMGNDYIAEEAFQIVKDVTPELSKNNNRSALQQMEEEASKALSLIQEEAEEGQNAGKKETIDNKETPLFNIDELNCEIILPGGLVKNYPGEINASELIKELDLMMPLDEPDFKKNNFNALHKIKNNLSKIGKKSQARKIELFLTK